MLEIVLGVGQGRMLCSRRGLLLRRRGVVGIGRRRLIAADPVLGVLRLVENRDGLCLKTVQLVRPPGQVARYLFVPALCLLQLPCQVASRRAQFVRVPTLEFVGVRADCPQSLHLILYGLRHIGQSPGFIPYGVDIARHGIAVRKWLPVDRSTHPSVPPYDAFSALAPHPMCWVCGDGPYLCCVTPLANFWSAEPKASLHLSTSCPTASIELISFFRW